MSRTDADLPITLAQLLRAEVVDESGRSLGRVNDVCADRAPGATGPDQAPRYRVTSLDVGRRGIAERLGLGRDGGRSREHEALSWEDVVRVEANRVVVRGPAAGPRDG